MKKDFANLDGFRVYKVKNRGDKMGDRLYIAPVYVIGLPGDVALLNKEIDIEKDPDWKMQKDNIDSYVKELTKPRGIHLP